MAEGYVIHTIDSNQYPITYESKNFAVRGKGAPANSTALYVQLSLESGAIGRPIQEITITGISNPDISCGGLSSVGVESKNVNVDASVLESIKNSPITNSGIFASNLISFSGAFQYYTGSTTIHMSYTQGVFNLGIDVGTGQFMVSGQYRNSVSSHDHYPYAIISCTVSCIIGYIG